MMDVKIDTLMQYLNVKMVCILEDDFIEAKSTQEVLSSIVKYFHQENIKALCEELELEDERRTQLYDNISEFMDKISLLDHENHIEFEEFLKVNEPLYFFESKMSEHKDAYDLGKYIIDQFEELSEKDSEFYSKSLKYGAGGIPTDYKGLFSVLQKSKDKKLLRIYKDAPQSHWHAINNDLKSNVSEEEFCIFILDQYVGGNPRAGEEFVTKNILNDDELKKKNIASIIFTSLDDKLDKDNSYTICVKKTEKPLNSIAKGLAKCAYAHLFSLYKDTQLVAIEKAFTLALKGRGNMIYLANMAHAEGVTVFEVINNWIDLVKQSYITNRLMSNESSRIQFSTLAGLTNFINEEYLDEEADLEPDFRDVLKQISNFEIFDYSINEQNAPPGSGDVYYFKDQIFVLVGQDCDLIVRKNSKGNVERKLKMADILISRFQVSDMNEKLAVKDKSLYFNYFTNADEKNGVLVIELNKHDTVDFSILDLCTFNKDGHCRISLTNELDINIKKLLPNMWNEYYLKLREKFSALAEVATCSAKDLFRSVTDGMRISLLDCEINGENNEISFPVRRLCRIKPQYREFLMKYYWEERSRAGINTMIHTKEEVIQLSKVRTILPGGNPKDHRMDYYVTLIRTNDREENRKKHMLSIMGDIEPMVEKIPQLNLIRNGRVVIQHGQSSVVDQDSNIKISRIIEGDTLVGLEFKVPYIVNINNKYINSDSVNGVDLLDDRLKSELDKENKPVNYTFINNSAESGVFMDENGYRELPIRNVLGRGILIQGRNIEIRIRLLRDTIVVDDNALTC